MPSIEKSSGLQTIITPYVHYRFHWMGDHWKQEIASDGGCEAIPQIWSIEGQVTRDGRLAFASPSYQRLDIEQVGPSSVVARLEGQAGSHRHSAEFAVEERPEEIVVDVTVRGSGSEDGLIATYLIESSDGRLEQGEAATITWPNPDTTLVFEAEPPSKIEAHEAGMGTIRLKAIAAQEPSPDGRTLRYRWRWISRPGHRIWDREV